MRRMAGLWAALLLVLALTPVQAGAVELPIRAEAALLMEKETGQVLYAQNEHEALEPASVTKVMTLLLTMEAIEKGSLHYDDMVTVSAYAASMGGSHVYLSEGEQITVDDLLKAVCVASGNDAAVALAECVAGVTELFVEQMNTRAKELGMTDTHFVNCTGLPAEGHVTSAWDIALMSRELIEKHPDIRRYTTIWMDTLRDGTFQLANTNKLIRFYDGATGLKTGSTDSAKYCLSATAEREGMELIAVVLKSPTGQQRFEDAKALLNYVVQCACCTRCRRNLSPPSRWCWGRRRRCSPASTRRKRWRWCRKVRPGVCPSPSHWRNRWRPRCPPDRSWGL